MMRGTLPRAASVFHVAVCALASWLSPPRCALAADALSALPQVADAVRRDLSQGRFWSVSRALRADLAPLASASLEDRMVLAEAEAGWGNHAAAAHALLAGGRDTLGAPARFWHQLGTARQAMGDATGAAASLARFIDGVLPGSPISLSARARLAVVLAAAGRVDDARDALLEVSTGSGPLGDWAALETARTLSELGDADGSRRVLALVADSSVRARGWRLEADAWAGAGDTALALAALAGSEESASARGTRATVEWLALEWRFRLALGDSAGAVRAMEEVLALGTGGGPALDAARAHWTVASGSAPDVLIRVATALGRGHDYGLASRAWRLAEERGGVLEPWQRLALARAYRGSGELERAVQEYRALAGPDADPGVAAPALRSWAEVRTRQGRHGDAAILRDRLVERYPESSEALDIVFFRGDDHQDQGRLQEAVEHYQQVVSMSEGASRSGLARMRWGQIRLTQDDPAAAAAVFAGYLDAFPDGRRWEEASYWGAHAAQLIGDTSVAERWRDRIRRQSPTSYYAVLAAHRAGADFQLRLPAGGEMPPRPEWLSGAVALLGLLEQAGLVDAVDAQVSRMREMAGDSEGDVLHLAMALDGAGRTLDAIRLGLALRRMGRPWDRTLLAIVYPFPYRDMVLARARELGLDPFLLAGIMRQESAFSPTIVSPAGAVGLMQVMPATGRQLARRIGLGPFQNAFLERAEVNLHLGTRFLADLVERYDRELTLVLAAYNAGPTRANRWRNFVEAEDPLRFTERIPFAETREYVKIVTRNRALYRWLYGDAVQGLG